jgi:hypothetical protein
MKNMIMCLQWAPKSVNINTHILVGAKSKSRTHKKQMRRGDFHHFIYLISADTVQLSE